MLGARKTTLKNNQGSTTVELVVVFVLVGILVAVAMPRLMDTNQEVRVAALNNLQAGLLAGASAGNARCRFTQGCFTSGWATVSVTNPDGSSGRMYNGYPTSNATTFASHITKWVEVTGFSVDTTNPLFTDFLPADVSSPSDCKLRYRHALTLGEAPSVELTTSGC